MESKSDGRDELETTIRRTDQAAGGGKLFTLKDAIAWLAHTLNDKA
jgi:hypothetical protein